MLPNLIRTLAVVVIGLMMVLADPIHAQSRDPDGSRLQARRIKAGEMQRATLSPPHDTVDWRYIRIRGDQTISIVVEAQPSDRTVDVTITNSVGEELRQASSSRGRATLQQAVQTGVYYISVSARQDLRYSIRVD